MEVERGSKELNALPGSASSLFRSFWIGGFEGADHRNGSGRALDPAVATGHLRQVELDYAQLARVCIRTVRESLGWRLTETAGGAFDFSRLRRYIAAADQSNIQILWTPAHYGVPTDVDYFDDRFIARLVRFTEAAARQIRRLTHWSGVALCRWFSGNRR